MEQVKQIINNKFNIKAKVIDNSRISEMTNDMLMIEVINKNNDITIMISDYRKSHTSKHKNIFELASNTKYFLNKTYKASDMEQIKTDIEAIEL